MARQVGTVARGIRAPIIREGDDIVAFVVEALLSAAEQEGFQLQDRDVVAVTEAVVARAQGNYATIAQIAQDVGAKLGNAVLGLTFPILSRNRFAICLLGIAQAVRKIVLVLQYPTDEVGNPLVDWQAVDAAGLDSAHDVLTLARYRQLFGATKHLFTGVDYVSYYQELIESVGAEVEILFANDPRIVLEYSKQVLVCDIHNRERSKAQLLAAGAERVCLLTDLLNAPVAGSGYNPQYGLLGSNKAREDTVKLFPRDCQPVVDAIQAELYQRTGCRVEVMVYGDGAFKDPVGRIWELADPVVSPAYTIGLEGTPNELKLKYLADNQFAHLQGAELQEAIRQSILNKEEDLQGRMETQGTTPRRLTDLLGSLCDLTSGSGDKGTPIVLVQNYFDNYAQI